MVSVTAVLLTPDLQLISTDISYEGVSVTNVILVSGVSDPSCWLWLTLCKSTATAGSTFVYLASFQSAQNIMILKIFESKGVGSGPDAVGCGPNSVGSGPDAVGCEPNRVGSGPDTVGFEHFQKCFSIVPPTSGILKIILNLLNFLTSN